MPNTSLKPDQVFVVRAWQEELPGDPNASDWRGRVSHLNTQSEIHFVGLTALKRLLQRLLGRASEPAGPASQENADDRQ